MAGKQSVFPGERYGRLVVLRDAGRNRAGGRVFLCQCDCGNTKLAAARKLKEGRTKSCGCAQADAQRSLRPKTRPVQDRFWEKVKMTATCWIWTGYVNDTGYGELHYNGRTVRATHVSWYLATGEWPPKGMFVCHTCDNPACVRPDHLFLGTPYDNVQDMRRKGRHAHGERVPGVRLTEEQVLEIVQLHEHERLPEAEIAAMYGVAKTTVRSIVNGNNWNWLTGRR